MSSKDPLRYFRIEARELHEGICLGFSALEQTPGSREIAMELMRKAHTLKGAARVVGLSAVADQAHGLEEALVQALDRGDAGSVLSAIRERVKEIERSLEEVGLRAPAPERKGGRGTLEQLEEPAETVRVELEEINQLIRDMIELRSRISTLSSEVGQLGGDRRLQLQTDRIERDFDQLQEKVGAFRLIPLEQLKGALEKTASEIAQAEGKQVEFRFVTGDLRIESQALWALQTALLHLVRNAVHHGIETAEERSQAGKNPTGTVEIRAERVNREARIAIRDDGRGIDLGSFRSSSHDLQSLSDEELLEQLFKPGVSTAQGASLDAGRGMGLDIVRQSLERLGGSVKLSLDSGTRIELRYPMKLSWQKVLIFRDGEIRGSIPLDQIVEVLPGSAARSGPTLAEDSLIYHQQTVPVVRPGLLVGSESGGQKGFLAILRTNEGPVGLRVQEFRESRDVVLQPLPPVVEAAGLFSAGWLNSQGEAELLWDAEGLRRQAALQPAAGPQETTDRPRLPVLVVDDSLTTRMLQQSILESAGYPVLLAASAKEGLRLARSQRVGMMLVDVEMPGMNGFEMVQQVKADPELQEIPCVMVSSRSAPEDKKKASEAGASGYVVKGEFDQARLLKLIRERALS